MVDYTRQISASTTLMIRDLGGWIEFWMKTGSQTWNNEQPWSFSANGGESGTRHFRMLAGGNWQQMGSVYVSYNQTVRLSIYSTGLSFPSYDFYQSISRSRVPDAPFIWDTIAISSTHIRVQFSAGYDGGTPALEYSIGYGGNPNAPEAWWASNGFSELGPFSPGQRVYFWATTRNSVGWSPWSNRTDTSTWRVPDAPPSLTITKIDQTSVQLYFTDSYDGGTPLTARQIGYSLESSAPVTIVSASFATNDFSNLDPGKTYYFWSRNQNAVGWSPWSAVTQVTLIAGARVYATGQWRRAVPYIKVGGVWKVGRPWVRSAGVWKETSL